MVTLLILSVGDELVLGQTVDTNSAWLSAELAGLGGRVLGHVTVGDDRADIADAIRSAASRADVVIVTGGVGPTPDDLTRFALADVLNRPLVTNEAWVRGLQAFFGDRGRRMPESNRVQAMIPEGADLLDNPVGTAAGIAANIPRPDGAQGVSTVYVLPGVPQEMRAMAEKSIFDPVRIRAGGAAVRSRVLHTFGLGESVVAERLGDLMDRRRNPTIGTTVSGGLVSIRINSAFESPARAAAELDASVSACREVLGDLIFGVDETTLPEAVGSLLRGRPGETVTTAESCTGGLVMALLTEVPGSSVYVREGWVTYSNQAKIERLGVSAGLIDREGVVSEPVVSAMAAGSRERASATYALAVSGVAGPDGGTAAKPVGTVCVAIASPGGVKARTYRFPGNRATVRDRTAKSALHLLRYALLSRDLPDESSPPSADDAGLDPSAVVS